MRAEFYIENQPVDISEDISALLTLAIDDIKEFSERSTTWSKTIVLPGTANNNKILGHIFQVGQANDYNPALPNYGYNFNASKSAACLIFQDNIQSFKGVMRLLQINIDAGRVEYEVSVFGDLFSLNVELSSGLLTDLDFSAYNHEYNTDNIIASWDADPGSGYYYPLIDYGNYSEGKHNWDIRTLRPALYVKEYIDKMFSAAGFRYNCALFNTTRFKRLVVPNNQKALFGADPVLMTVSNPSPTSYNTTLNDDPIIYQTRDLGSNFTTSDGGYTFKYIGLVPLTVELSWTVSGNYRGTKNYFLQKYINATAQFPFIELSASVTPYAFSNTVKSTVTLNTNDLIRTFGNGGFDNAYAINFTGAELSIKSAVGTSAPLNPGDDVDINFNMPKNVRQINFLVSIVQLFNLYVYEDKFDNRLINIAPYIDFYSTDSSNSIDWTYKLNRDGVIKIKPMSELNSKLYKFNYKDDGDYYNDLYKKRYGQGYGSYIFDTEYEFAAETNSLELIFSPTALVGYSGEDKVYSTICKINNPDNPESKTEENIDSNIRILQTKKVTGVTVWAIKNGEVTLTNTTSYGYAGHFDDPDAPSNDLNFGALQQLFFDLAAGALSATQFNVYWSSYMAEITNKDSKLMIGEFHLKPTDIYSLDFSTYITVDGVLFRLNKIIDYNANQPALCKAELLKVINTIY